MVGGFGERTVARLCSENPSNLIGRHSAGNHFHLQLSVTLASLVVSPGFDPDIRNDGDAYYGNEEDGRELFRIAIEHFPHDTISGKTNPPLRRQAIRSKCSVIGKKVQTLSQILPGKDA
jgi:hypothetical protein